MRSRLHLKESTFKTSVVLTCTLTPHQHQRLQRSDLRREKRKLSEKKGREKEETEMKELQRTQQMGLILRSPANFIKHRLLTFKTHAHRPDAQTHTAVQQEYCPITVIQTLRKLIVFMSARVQVCVCVCSYTWICQTETAVLHSSTSKTVTSLQSHLA